MFCLIRLDAQELRYFQDYLYSGLSEIVLDPSPDLPDFLIRIINE